MRALLAALTLIAAIGAANAQISGLRMSGPPPFGLLLGDVFELKTEFDVAPPFRLDPSSLPKPGPVTYWLDLRSLKVDEKSGPNGARRYAIAAEYQTFYAPLEAIEQTVPAFKLVVTDGAGKRSEAQSASWKFLTSPLRPVVGTAGGAESAYVLRPDAEPARKSLRRSETIAAAAVGATALALLALAWSRAWPPFHARRSRPFARAARLIRRQAKAGEDGWRSAALALHRAFDVAAGRRLLGDDLAGFLSDRPAFRRHETAIASFFEASRNAFFGPRGAPNALSGGELARLARELAAAERAS